jgi:hypothetical protein
MRPQNFAIRQIAQVYKLVPGTGAVSKLLFVLRPSYAIAILERIEDILSFIHKIKNEPT